MLSLLMDYTFLLPLSSMTSLCLHCYIVRFGETKLQHFESLKNREWFLDDAKVEELYEYKNLCVLKNYVG